MKKVLLIFILSFALFSCTSDDLVLKDVDLQFTSQKWELVEMTGSWVNSSTKGDDMAWQEHYIFNPDGTFFKSRIRDSITIEANGIFEIVEFDNDEADYLELTFTSGMELVGSCGNGDQELLRFVSKTELYNTWMACDGPGLYYVLDKD